MNNYSIIKSVKTHNKAYNRILFGNIYKTIEINEETKIYVLEPTLIFMDRWEGSNYGTSKWLIYIFRTGKNFRTTLPHVSPKVDLLFFCFGATRVKRTLNLLKELSNYNIDFNKLSAEYWIYQNARINTGKPLILPHHET